MSANEKTVARVWSQYEQVKEHVAGLHMGFVSNVVKMKAALLAGRVQGQIYKENKIGAYQNLYHLLHFAILSGAIIDNEDKAIPKVRNILDNWQNTNVKELMSVIDQFEKWFAQSYFYDVRVNEDNRQIIDIEATMKAAGL